MLPYSLPSAQEEETKDLPILAVLRNVVRERLALRVRARALIELMVAKGIVSHAEMEERMALIWRRDRAALIDELWEQVLSDWESKPEVDLCLECGAACCKSAVIIVTPSEADVLRRRARELDIEDLEIYATADQTLIGDRDPHSEAEWAMLAASCVFLDKTNRCRIYADRPLHCVNHPTFWREDCAVSWRRYHINTVIPRLSPGIPPVGLAQRLAGRPAPSP